MSTRCEGAGLVTAVLWGGNGMDGHGRSAHRGSQCPVKRRFVANPYQLGHSRFGFFNCRSWNSVFRSRRTEPVSEMQSMADDQRQFAGGTMDDGIRAVGGVV